MGLINFIGVECVCIYGRDPIIQVRFNNGDLWGMTLDKRDTYILYQDHSEPGRPCLEIMVQIVHDDTPEEMCIKWMIERCKRYDFPETPLMVGILTDYLQEPKCYGECKGFAWPY